MDDRMDSTSVQSRIYFPCVLYVSRVSSVRLSVVPVVVVWWWPLGWKVAVAVQLRQAIHYIVGFTIGRHVEWLLQSHDTHSSSTRGGKRFLERGMDGCQHVWHRRWLYGVDGKGSGL